MAAKKSWWTRFEGHPVGAMILVGAAVITIIGGIFGLASYLWPRDGAGAVVATTPVVVKPTDDSAKLVELTPEVQVSRFREILGPEVFVNRKPKYVEYIFARPQYLVQAVTDLTDRVILFSVVARSDAFNPDLGKVMGNGGPMQGSLRRSFSETGPSFPVSFGAIIPADHGPVYWEIFWDGNPGNFLYYGLLDSSAGKRATEQSSTAMADILFYKDSSGGYFPETFGPVSVTASRSYSAAESEALSRIRAGLRTNGYLVTARFLDFSLLDGFIPGPSDLQTRLLPP